MKGVLVSILVLLQTTSISAQNPKVPFSFVTYRDGLSQSFVTDIAQDNNGYMWFATWMGGLNRYDGETCRQYLPSVEHRYSLASSTVTSIATRKDGGIWVGFENGVIQKYDPINDQFSRIDTCGSETMRFTNPIGRLLEDDFGKLWVLERNGCVAKFDPATKHWVEVRHLNRISESTWRNARGWLFTDFEGNVTTKKGWRFYTEMMGDPTNTQSKSVRITDFFDPYWQEWLSKKHPKLFYKCEELRSWYSGKIRAQHAFMDRDQNIWLSCKQHLIKISQSNSLDTIVLPTELREKWNNARIYYQDGDGTIWGSYSGGVFYFNPQTLFNIISSEEQEGYRVTPRSIRRICSYPGCDSCLIVTGYYGTDMINIGRKASQLFKTGFYDILPINQDSFLVAREVGGFYLYLPNNDRPSLPSRANTRVTCYRGCLHSPCGEVTNWISDNICDSSIAPPNGYSLKMDSQGRIWGGADRGIYRYDRHYNRWESAFDGKTSSRRRSPVRAIIEGPNGFIWAGAGGRLIRISPKDKVKVFDINLEETPILSLHIDKNGTMFIGTLGAGLVTIPIQQTQLNTGDQLKPRVLEIDLPDQTIYGIEEDENSRLWCSTNKGLFVLMPTGKTSFVLINHMVCKEANSTQWRSTRIKMV